MESDKPTLEIPFGFMAHPHYEVAVYPYLFGQFRIHLCLRKKLVDGDFVTYEPYHNIVRELDTYSEDRMTVFLSELMQHPEPEFFCESLVKSWNCENLGGRIRLDNTPQDVVKGV